MRPHEILDAELGRSLQIVPGLEALASRYDAEPGTEHSEGPASIWIRMFNANPNAVRVHHRLLLCASASPRENFAASRGKLSPLRFRVAESMLLEIRCKPQ